MARSGPVKAVSVAQAKYQTSVGGAGKSWNDGIQGCRVNPMQLAAAQADKAAANYAAVVFAGGPWAMRMSSMSVSDWKTPSAAKQAKYTGAAPTAAAKWGQWWSTKGMQTAQQVRDTAAANRQAGMSGVDRAVAAIQQMAASGKRQTA